MRIVLERRISGGRTIRAVVESLTIEGHTALTSLRDHQGINLALVNVLDVAQDAIITEPGPRSEATNPVGGACGDDTERISDR